MVRRHHLAPLPQLSCTAWLAARVLRKPPDLGRVHVLPPGEAVLAAEQPNPAPRAGGGEQVAAGFRQARPPTLRPFPTSEDLAGPRAERLATPGAAPRLIEVGEVRPPILAGRHRLPLFRRTCGYLDRR